MQLKQDYLYSYMHVALERYSLIPCSASLASSYAVACLETLLYYQGMGPDGPLCSNCCVSRAHAEGSPAAGAALVVITG